MPFDGTQLNATAAHLLRAKRYIEEHGWCDFGAESVEGTVCVARAIGYTSDDPDLLEFGVSDETTIMFAKTIGVRPDGGGEFVGVWNDTPGRTVEEVYAAFDRAIALAMEAGGN